MFWEVDRTPLPNFFFLGKTPFPHPPGAMQGFLDDLYQVGKIILHSFLSLEKDNEGKKT